MEGLEYESDMPAAKQGWFVNCGIGLAAKMDFSGCRRIQQANQIEQAGLAATARADNGEKFAFLHLQVESIEGSGVAVVEVQGKFFGAYDGFCGH